MVRALPRIKRLGRRDAGTRPLVQSSFRAAAAYCSQRHQVSGAGRPLQVESRRRCRPNMWHSAALGLHSA